MLTHSHYLATRVTMGAPDPLWIMHKYINAHDHLHPLHPQLWLQSDGLTPISTWWIYQFWQFFPDSNLAGQSMWASGAVPDLIMGSGWWTSAAWTSYMWKNPILLHTLLLTWMTHFQPLMFAWTFILSSTYISPVLYHLCLSHFFFLLSYLYIEIFLKNPPSSLFYHFTLIHLFSLVFLLNRCKIYVADPSHWAEMGHTVISCSGVGLGQFPGHLSAYKSKVLSGKHRWLVDLHSWWLCVREGIKNRSRYRFKTFPVPTIKKFPPDRVYLFPRFNCLSQYVFKNGNNKQNLVVFLIIYHSHKRNHNEKVSPYILAKMVQFFCNLKFSKWNLWFRPSMLPILVVDTLISPLKGRMLV